MVNVWKFLKMVNLFCILLLQKCKFIKSSVMHNDPEREFYIGVCMVLNYKVSSLLTIFWKYVNTLNKFDFLKVFYGI